MENIITIKNLKKRYGIKTVLDNINITIKEGEIYGIIGNNGAGKSTLLKLICGFTNLTAGEISISPNLISKKSNVGCLIEKPGLFLDMTAYENIKAKALFLNLKYSKKDIQDLIKLVGLEEVGKKRVRAFSMGMKQRLGIAIALVGNPKLLILDEPINGLDPQGIKEIRQLILKLHNEKDITFMISSHILDELAKVATRFCIIHKGKIIKECTKDQFMLECADKDIDDYYLEIINSSEEK